MVALGLWGAWMGCMFLCCLAGPYLAYTARLASRSPSKRAARAGCQAKKLAGGFAMPVRTFACAGPPSALTLARLAGRLSEMRYHLPTTNCDPADGQVRESLTEDELAQRLFGGMISIACKEA